MNKFILSWILLSLFSVANALTIKIGVLAPEGTTWANTLKKMAKEIKKATDKKVKFKIYFGGAQGDEPDVLRKIRVGQLHGGIFTGKTLGDINGDVRVMEIPFTFYDDRKKAIATLTKMTPFFNKGFEKAEFKNLGFFGIGRVYFVSSKKTMNLADLKGLKIWSWDGDTLVDTMIQEMNLVSVPLSLPDVLGSLSTGMVEAAYAPPLAIIALQWNTKVKYLVDFPLSFSVGSLLIGDKTWKKMPAAHQAIVKKISNRYITDFNDKTSQDNADALTAIKGYGVQFVKFPDEDIAQAKSVRSSVISKLKGKLFSADAVKRINEAL